MAPRRLARGTLAVLAWATVVAVVGQFFLAGVGLFGVASMETHMLVGYWVPLLPLLMIVAALPARADRRTFWLCLGLSALLMLQTSLPYFRGQLPVIAALHPPNALLIFWLAVVVARRATGLTRREPAASGPARPTAPADRGRVRD